MMADSTEDRIKNLYAVLENDYPECDCPEDDRQPLCTHCLIIESLNEVGAIVDDIWKYLRGRPGNVVRRRKPLQI